MTTGYEKYIDILKGRLKPRRFNHSLEVAKEAKRLAVLYGADAEKAYLAGLLHDITKNETRDAQLQLFKQFGIILTDIEMNAEKLWHAITGAKYIENILKILIRLHLKLMVRKRYWMKLKECLVSIFPDP